MNTGSKQETATNLYIIDKAFYMPQLQRSRRIWLYLPPEYRSSKDHYPVLYMQDGQNLFEEWSAFGEEWGVDETLDRLKEKCIVVGIDNGGDRRINEYAMHDHEKYGKAEGSQYLDFLVNTLKPYIDETYRTLPDREYTIIAGSSLGALISFYACLYYPQVFGAAGIFSPAFWIDPHLQEETKRMAKQNSTLPQRFYFYYGEREGREMTTQTAAMIRLMKTVEHYTLKTVINKEGIHSEAEWRSAFLSFYQWIISRGAAKRNSREKSK